MKYRLKKDIVIPEGTIFDDMGECITQTFGTGHLSKIIGLTENTYGEVLYNIDPGADEAEDWFEEV